MPQESDARKTVKQLVDEIKKVFKKSTRSARERTWKALHTKIADREVGKLIINPDHPVIGTNRWLTYGDWVERKEDVLSETTMQISREQFYQILRWLTALRMNYGAYCRPGTDITKGDFGIHTSDPQRLIRIFQWALGQFREIEKDLGGSLPPKPQEIKAGNYDDKIVPILKKLSQTMRSVQHNFQQVGFDHPNTNHLVQMLAPYQNI